MKVSHVSNIEQKPVTMEGSQGCKVQWLIGEQDGAPNFAMRQFEVQPGGHTPRHHHPYEHEVYVLEGSGVVVEGDSRHGITKGDVVLVQPNEIHQFLNEGSEPLKFLCLIPNEAANLPVTVDGVSAPECNG